MIRKLEPRTWQQGVTLASLWQAWMTLNKFDLHSAQSALTKLGVHGVKNLPIWMQNRVTNDLLTTGMKGLMSATGIDLDGWMVCEAKSQVLNEHPELVGLIDFDRLVTRQECCQQLHLWRDLYNGEQYIALQLKISSKAIRNWIHGKNLPSIEALKKIIAGCTRGLIQTSNREDLIFTLICQTILGASPMELFGFETFQHACEQFLRPLRGYTNTRIGVETGVGRRNVEFIEGYANGEKVKFAFETIENVLGELIRQRNPHLVEAFKARRKEYRLREDDGIWSVKEILRLDDPPVVQTSSEVQSVVATQAPKACEQKPDSSSVREIPVHKDTPVSTSLNERELASIPCAQSEDTLQAALMDIFAFGAQRLGARGQTRPSTVSLASLIGSEISGLKACLTQVSYLEEVATSIKQDEIEDVRLAVEQLRRVLVALNNLDRSFVRERLRPVLGTELFELFLAGQGLQHLLETPEAWDLIAAQRESAGFKKTLSRKEG